MSKLQANLERMKSKGFRAVQTKRAAQEIADTAEKEKNARLQAARVRIAAEAAAKKSF